MTQNTIAINDIFLNAAKFFLNKFSKFIVSWNLV